MSATAIAAMPEIRGATFDDYDRIVELEAAHGMASMQRDDWQRLWLGNPLWSQVGHDWPIGWVMEADDGRLVGSLINIPSRYLLRGRELLCANGRGWVVDADYRGFALALMGEYFGQPNIDLYVNTTVGPSAADVNAALNNRIPRGDFQTFAYFATAYRGLVAKGLRKLRMPCANLFAVPAAGLLRLRDAWRLKSLPHTPAGVTIESLDRFDEQFDRLWVELACRKSNTLLSFRDRATLDWHFASSLRRKETWVLTASRGDQLRGYCILKLQDPDGDFRRMRLIDYQSAEPSIDLLPGLLRAAIKRCRAEGVEVLEHLGCDLTNTAAFERFAPYRRTQACWPFYYRTDDDKLAVELADPNLWEASAYDGDASYD